MINIYPADINQAGWYYKAQKTGIMMSLGMIKGVGYRSVVEIVEERKKDHLKISMTFVPEFRNALNLKHCWKH